MNKKPLKPGSSPADAKKLGGPGDFGVPQSDPIERSYTSANTRHGDPGVAQMHSGSADSRETGVGGNASGPGSASGGDIDADFVGVANGNGFSQNGPDQNYQGGPDEAQPNSHTSPPKAAPRQNLNAPGKGESTVSRDLDNTNRLAQGPDSATNPRARNDDSFAGEITRDEASGRNAL